MNKRAAVLLADGFEETEAVTVIDVLRRAHVDVTVAGVTGRRVTGSHAIVIEADTTLVETSGAFDLVVLPGGMPGAAHLRDSTIVRAFVTKQYAGGAVAAAICAAPIALSHFGLLDGKHATCFPGFEEQLGKAHLESKPVVVDGSIVTSRGVGTALAFSLALVSQLMGPTTAHELEEDMLVS